MRKTVLAVGFALACVGPLRAQQSAAPAYTDQTIGVAFPATLGGLKFEAVHKYEEPGAGYSLRYRGNDITKADVYVYDKKLSHIPTGHDNSMVKAEAAEIREVLNIMQKRGDYRNVSVTKTGVKPAAGNIRFLWSRCEYIQVSKESAYRGMRISESFVTGFHGKFVKVRFDYKKADSEAGQQTSDKLGKELAQLFATTEAGANASSPDAVLIEKQQGVGGDAEASAASTLSLSRSTLLVRPRAALNGNVGRTGRQTY